MSLKDGNKSKTRPWDITGAGDLKLGCRLPGCQRHVYVDPGRNGKVHDYCGQTHAKQAGHLTDDKGIILRLNGGFPSPSYTNDQASSHQMKFV